MVYINYLDYNNPNPTNLLTHSPFFFRNILMAPRAKSAKSASAAAVEEIRVMLPKHKGQRAKRIVARIPTTLFKDQSMDVRQKGASLSQTISDVYEDIQEDVLPERTNAVGIALFLLVSYKIISENQHADILKEMGVKPATSSQHQRKSASSQRKPASPKRSVSFASSSNSSNADDAASEEGEYSDISEVSDASEDSASSAEDAGDDEEDDPLKIVLYTLTDEKFNPKEAHVALADYFHELHPDDLHNIEEFLTICVEWLGKTQSEVRATEVAQQNPWLVDMFAECIQEVPAKVRPRLKMRFERTSAQVHTELEKAIADDGSEGSGSDVEAEADEFVGGEQESDW